MKISRNFKFKTIYYNLKKCDQTLEEILVQSIF